MDLIFTLSVHSLGSQHGPTDFAMPRLTKGWLNPQTGVLFGPEVCNQIAMIGLLGFYQIYPYMIGFSDLSF